MARALRSSGSLAREKTRAQRPDANIHHHNPPNKEIAKSVYIESCDERLCCPCCPTYSLCHASSYSSSSSSGSAIKRDTDFEGMATSSAPTSMLCLFLRCRIA